MLDTTTMTTAKAPAWHDHLTYGDIVAFRFPLAEEGSAGQPKARPCLILDIEVRGGQRYAVLAYGTTSRRRSNVGYEVHVRRRDDYISAGLNEPTRFVGARRLSVPLTHSGFVMSRAKGSAVIGRLGGAAFDAMNSVRGRIHAEADIAEARRARRRTTRRRAGDVVVAARYPRRRSSTGQAVQQ